MISIDEHYKGLMEVLVDKDGLMNGFKVHWPNNTESTYRRTEAGIDMCNCLLDLPNSTIQLFVGLFAQQRSSFSPLVEANAQPIYTKIDGSDGEVRWPL
jgi:hypothetical protein